MIARWLACSVVLSARAADITVSRELYMNVTDAALVSVRVRR